MAVGGHRDQRHHARTVPDVHAGASRDDRPGGAEYGRAGDRGRCRRPACGRRRHVEGPRRGRGHRRGRLAEHVGVSVRSTGRIPVGTLAVNAVGSFVLGLMIGWAAHGPVAPQLQALVMTGLCGGLTTFSTFCGDTVQLCATSPMPALDIMLVSLAGGMALYVAGLHMIRTPRDDA
ncbi:MAG: CrcB family protein [Bifidobacterium castoris]|nr:CrcB family protein [Bifidobacterium castoris]